ncbi:MAG: hypothetical protein QOI66_5398 [Myxococcales bacterium]|jgi:hypothetical protein|nr:hypothetical protein [Myxococcales bacterium]
MGKPKKVKKMGVITGVLAAVIGIVSVVAGTSSCDSVDAAFDCQAVCSRYRDCYDSTYDVGKCRDNCRTNADNDAAKRQKADDCEACIGDKSCLSATFSCAAACAGVVP